MSDLDRLNEWKAKIETAKRELATLEGRQETLHERASQIRKTMQESFGVKTLGALEKAIEAQKEEVRSLASELEEAFGGS